MAALLRSHSVQWILVISMRAWLSMCLIPCLAACATNGERIDQLAAEAHLQRSEIKVGTFKTVVYEQQTASSLERPFVVFLEGDGVPWLRGVTPSTDPTTNDPLALKLLTHSNTNGAYVSRPCYQEMHSAGCTPDLWTNGRYSQQVVDVMVGAVQKIVERSRAQHVALVGFSGGGTLAVLVAERIPTVNVVVTLAANLDTDAWTAHHGYLALESSLNPAHSEQSHSFTEIHLIGRLDSVVPVETRDAYFARFPGAKQWVLDAYTHSCCWLDDWSDLSQRIDAELGAPIFQR